jgi:hypothetical protein
MTEIIFSCGCCEDAEQHGGTAFVECPEHGLTPPEDEPEEAEGAEFLCPLCGDWHPLGAARCTKKQ